MLKNKKRIVALSLLPAIAIVKLLAFFPEFVETYYSCGVYPYISKLFRFSLGWLPFSFGDLIYAFGIAFIVRWLIVNRKRIVKDFKNWLIDVFAAISILYMAFNIIWGLNYYRLPLHVNLNIDSEYSTETLVAVTKKLIEKSNAVHLEITKDSTLKVDIPYSKSDILERVPSGYSNLKDKFPRLDYNPKSIKQSIFSLPLTYMGFSGYLNPLTNEAHIDYMIPAFKYPTTASHEVAHQLGYAAENEANFIGCLVTTNHNDIYFRYSGYTFGLRHCLHEIYRRDSSLYAELVPTINNGILKNYQEVRDFWDDYQNPMEPFFKETYNTYLQANSQKDGMKSYSYVVALLVNYFQDKTL